MGVLSALPVVNLGNLCCCLWVVASGMVAAYVLQQNQSTPITPADGAIVGLLAALAGAVVMTIISIPVSLVMAPISRGMMQQVLEQRGNLPPEVRDMIERYGADRADLGILGTLFIRMLGFIIFVFVGGIFSTLGDLLGAVIFSKKPQPAAN
jgi:hypothetical protein